MINLTAVWNVSSCVVVRISKNVGEKTTSVFRVEKNGIQAIYSSESVVNCYQTTRCHTLRHFADLKYQKLKSIINISTSWKIDNTLLFLSSHNVKESLGLPACYVVVSGIQLTTFRMLVVLSSSERISPRSWTE